MVSMIRYTVNFAGRVQGVGFRYTARRIATGFQVAGYVQNLRDGRVRLVGEGEKDQLDALVSAICRHMEGYVEHHEIEESQATGEFGTGGELGIRR